ncbi:MAG TPA: AmmeMemoRadiSam system protein B [Blastocatellia bacterium]|nr:AmmeMemoRadiSam system protein B [Blastocatellia bacterium]
MSGSIVFAGIAPHPPLLVPEVGGHRIKKVADSQNALREFSRRLVATAPDTVVVISPHSPLDASTFRVRSGEVLEGDFAEFNASRVALSFKNDLDLLSALKDACGAAGVPFEGLGRDWLLDHGAMVPLYYLREAGWSGPVVVAGLTMLSRQMHVAFGRAIAEAARAANKRVAVVASADLSHRLIIGGPYHYEPTAHIFDEQIVRSIREGATGGVLNVDDDLRERAGECGYRSILIGLGAAEENPRDHEVLSYEGPFGVGYMVAVLVEVLSPEF